MAKKKAAKKKKKAVKRAKKKAAKKQVCPIEPLDERVVIRQDDADKKSPGGIIIPDQSREKPDMGIVLAAGPGKQLLDGTHAEMHVDVGDKVVYNKYSGTDIEVDGVQLVVIPERDIIGIVH